MLRSNVIILVMFARLSYQYRTIEGNVGLDSQDLTWVANLAAATRFSQKEAQWLVAEMNRLHPGETYTLERDQDGEANCPPYGLDNFVVRKT